MRVANMKMSIDNESVNIYLDNGDDQDPTHIVYWHEDEWIEDPESVVGAMLKAIELFTTGRHHLLLEILGLKHLIPE